MPNAISEKPRLAPTRLSFLLAESKERKAIALYGLLSSCLFLCLAFSRPAFLTILDKKFYDAMHGSLSDCGPPLPVIVDIDEKSLVEFGQWPWPRYQVAELLEKIAAAGPSAVGLDIILAEPDRTSLKIVKRELDKGFGLELSLDEIPVRFHDNDTMLADVLARGPFVIGYQFLASGNGGQSPILHPLDVIILHAADSPNKKVNLPGGIGVVAPLPVFSRAVTRSGFVNIRPDDDGIIRRAPLLMRFQDHIYPSLALVSVMQAVNAKRVFLKTSALGVEWLQVNGTIIPLDASGNLLIRYRTKRRAFEYISAGDLLNDRIGKKVILGHVVFVGSSAAGLKDTYTTPTGPLYPEVEFHASVVDNILHKAFLKRPSWAHGAELFTALCVGILVSFVLSRSRPLGSLLFLGLGAVFLWFGGLWMLQSKNVFISPLYPIIMLVGNFTLLGLFKLRIAEKQALQHAKEIEGMESELNVARDIQMGVLPKNFPPFPEHEEFDIFASLVPAREVGGDLYDFFFIDEEHLCFTLGDVSDKGVPASLFMVITRTLVKNSAQYYPSPSDMMSRINQILCADNPNVMFVTLIIGILNVRTGEIRYANGGHNPPILVRHGAGVSFKAESSGPGLGVTPEIIYKEATVTLDAKDGLFLYTDGVTEAMNRNGTLFSNRRLLQEVTSLQNRPVKDIITGVLQEVRRHAGSVPQSDDIAMMMIRYNGI
ncbi:MAG: CHASE2 domain-containing protein [Thermodesulfobacteriota bacterium]|nr:CHASE2 domain-containing protein [Thermodesulfobacteriota bacterium]